MLTSVTSGLQLPQIAMIELRDYQKDLLERVQKALEPDNARVMMQLPTGGGKTVIAAHLLSSHLKGGRKAVWLTHRRELAHQTDKRLTETAGILADSDKSGWVVGTPAPAIADGVKIMMAQTVSRRIANPNVWSRYNADDLMVIDEAHHATARGWELAMKYWPGRIVGMTATPWRLSYKEGFDHLFSELICGLQVVELQAEKSLCNARVLIPRSDQLILGGRIGSTGDYTESGIERANHDRPDVMTAGALGFWRSHAQDRQTIVYAVSKRHAGNLVDVFNNTGVSAELILGDTHPTERAGTIAKFSSGDLQVLVNVAVATEGFDLPDASCVAIARPSESLALYLQMVGRGLRPKPDGGDYVILDLAGNSLKHGLPENCRNWTLAPRSRISGIGEAPVVICDHCHVASPAGSHNCQSCGEPLGKDCGRCGKWRVWKRWRWEKNCIFSHDLVCDLCHQDAHIQNHLPILDMGRDMASDINNLTSRVVAVREEFQKKVVKQMVHADQSSTQAMRRLGEEVAQLSALIEETEATAQSLVADKEKVASHILNAVERSGLDDLILDSLNEPLTSLYFDFREDEQRRVRINGKTLLEIFGDADSDTMNRFDEVMERWGEILEQWNTTESTGSEEAHDTDPSDSERLAT